MKKILCLLASIFSAANICFANEINVDELLEKINESDKRINSLKLGYVQTITMGYSDQKQTMRGRAFFVKPDKIRVEQIDPGSDVFVTDGKRVWLYSPNFNQLMTGKWEDFAGGQTGFQGMHKGFLNFSNEMDSLKEDFEIELMKSEPGYYVMKLAPKKNAGYHIMLWVSKIDFFPIKTSIITQSSEISTEVVSIEKNLSISDKLFKFKKPKSAEVVEFPR